MNILTSKQLEVTEPYIKEGKTDFAWHPPQGEHGRGNHAQTCCGTKRNKAFRYLGKYIYKCNLDGTNCIVNLF